MIKMLAKPKFYDGDLIAPKYVAYLTNVNNNKNNWLCWTAYYLTYIYIYIHTQRDRHY
jgi:hypothetical protein